MADFEICGTQILSKSDKAAKMTGVKVGSAIVFRTQREARERGRQLCAAGLKSGAEERIDEAVANVNQLPSSKPELQVRTGLLRRTLMEIDSSQRTDSDSNKFWRERLFDAGIPTRITYRLARRDFDWSSILPQILDYKLLSTDDLSLLFEFALRNGDGDAHAALVDALQRDRNSEAPVTSAPERVPTRTTAREESVNKMMMRPRVNADSLFEVAPTLAGLRKLATAEKCRLLLARLAKVGEHHSALNKHNLMMPGDPYGLAHGYADAEKTPIREHLMGAPWTRLVNDGYLADPTGSGFYKVTEEGKEYLLEEQPPLRPAQALARMPAPRKGVPLAFLSYSWEGAEHREWVTKLAERLRGESGVEVIFDRWHLNPGNDKLHFMERAVAECDFVIVVCTPTYRERADKRQGGVGYESMVITAELAKQVLTNKFIPVLREGTWVSSVPSYLGSRMGVNLSDDPCDEGEYENLLRVLHGEPIQPPPLGTKPDFSTKLALKAKSSAAPDTSD
jgi:hypothetical protein